MSTGTLRDYVDRAGEEGSGLHPSGYPRGGRALNPRGWLRIDPNFEPLRGNPRFEKLARGK